MKNTQPTQPDPDPEPEPELDELVELLQLPIHADHRGELLPIEFSSLPISPSRIFVVKNVPIGETRGKHRHKWGDQLLICIAGRIQINVAVKNETREYLMDVSSNALLIKAGVWASQCYLTEDAALLVITTHPYNPASYDTAL